MIYFIVYSLIAFLVLGFFEEVSPGGNSSISLFWPISLPLLFMLAIGSLIGKEVNK